MKIAKIISIVAAIIILALILLFIGFRYFNPVGLLFNSMSDQIGQFKRYAKTLDDNDFKKWVYNAKLLALKCDSINPTYVIKENQIPDSMQKIGIRKIYVSRNSVSYVWLSGLDHSFLRVSNMLTDSCNIEEVFDDNDRKLIWINK